MYTTPNMNLIGITIGVDSGLQIETNTNTNTNTLDSHNHSPGSGVQITPAGLAIISDLTMGNNNLISVRSVRFVAQGSPLSNPADLGCLYESGTDLYYNDGSGNQVQITSGGAVNATSSGISSGTATASFVSSVLVVNAAPNTPANIQAGSVLIGNNIANSKFITLSPPSALAANYVFTFPPSPSLGMLQMDASGNVTSSDPSTQYISYSSNLLSLVTSNIITTFTFNTGGSIVMNGVPIILNNSSGVGGIGLRGFVTNVPAINSPTLALDASMILFRNTNGIVGAGSMGFYQDPTIDNAMWIQSNTNSNRSYTAVVSTTFSSAGCQRLITGAVLTGTSGSGTGFSYTSTSPSGGNITFNPTFASSTSPFVLANIASTGSVNLNQFAISVFNITNSGFSINNSNPGVSTSVHFVAIGIW